MQIKSLLVALGFAAAVNAAAIEQREIPAGQFKIRRFTPNEDGSVKSNNQYVSIASSGYISYADATEADATLFTLYGGNTLQVKTVSSWYNKFATSLQSYGITVTPLEIAGPGEKTLVSIGLGPIYEITFNTQRSGAAVSGWNGLAQIGGNVFVGKKSDISQPVYFRAWGYAPAV
ncbi:hypothetical protein ABW19_dt0203249 [Dactylella cylindrospora]|nr:hypothetical protein ABW19_dt0203249 [Dactylella cylindrospora]